MTGPLMKQLKGRDVRLLKAFVERLRAALGEALIDVQLVRVRLLDVDPALTRDPAAAAAVQPAAGTRKQTLPAPPPPPVRELLVVVHVERRDVTIDAQLDEAAALAMLEHGGVLAPLLITRRERRHLIEQGGAFGRSLEAGEVVP